MMSDQLDERWDRLIAKKAARFEYPPAPDVSGRVREKLTNRPVRRPGPRRLAWAAAALLLLTAILAVPDVRAAVAKWFQIGAVRILAVESGEAPPLQENRGSPLDVAGATTWEDARDRAGFLLRRPAYPATLGPPDAVFLQEMRDPGLGDVAVVTIWYDRGHPALALYQIAGSQYAVKAAAQDRVTEAAVHGEPAYWINGPHWLRLADGRLAEWLFVEGSVLVWVEDGITYRLEGAGSLDEAVRTAESMR